MVPLLGVSLCFAFGIAVEDRVVAPPWLWGLALGAGGISWLGLGPRARATGESAMAFAAGALALSLRLHAPLPEISAQPLLLTALEPPVRYGQRCGLVVWVHAARAGPAHVQAAARGCDLLPGQHALARLKPRPFRPPSNPGAREPAREWARRGVPTRLDVADAALVAVELERPGPAARVERVRRALGDVLDPRPAEPSAGHGGDAPTEPSVADGARSGRAGALLRALVTGERGGLAPRDVEAFRRSGTAHLLAISGLHVGWVLALVRGAVAALLWPLPSARLLRVRGPVATLAGVGAACAYALLAGAGVPAVRAAAMGLVGALALLGGRPAASANALLAAGLLVLALEPAALFSPGFHLSFAAVAGILVWRVPAAASRAWLHATLAATFATAPLIALLGGVLPAAGVLANAVAVPLFAIAVVPAALLAGVFALLVPEVAGPAPELARGLAALGLALVGQLESPDLLRGAASPVAVALGLSALGFGARASALRSGPAGLLAAALAALGGTLWLGTPAQAPAPELHVLDVGQGDAVLVRSGGSAWLFDAGPRFAGYDAGLRVVLPALRALGVTRLEALLLTHSDQDHVGGAASVLRALPTRELWLAPASRSHAALRAARARAAAGGTRVRLLRRGDVLELGELRARVLAPDVAPRRSANARSLVLELRSEEGCALLPGDLPARLERVLAPHLTPCQVLKLAHHGSVSSSSAAWLDALRPEVAIVSAGRRPRSPLPHPEVRARVEARGASLWETRRGGAIHVRFSAHGPVVAPFRID